MKESSAQITIQPVFIYNARNQQGSHLFPMPAVIWNTRAFGMMLYKEMHLASESWVILYDYKQHAMCLVVINIMYCEDYIADMIHEGENLWKPVPHYLILVSFRMNHRKLYTTTVSMMTTSNGTNFRVTGTLWESIGLFFFFTGIFFDLRLIKRLSKQSRRRWFETP